MKKKTVIIIGAGFGGLAAAKVFQNHKEFNIILIDRNNYHLFQPLLYQVATAALSPADIAVPIRTVFRNRKNVQVYMQQVVDINTVSKTVITDQRSFSYDYLILAPGSKHTYFGNDQWERFAPGLKTLDDALTIRERILRSLESAENEQSATARAPFLTYVVIGGGPTGVEMSAAIAEIVSKSIRGEYRNIRREDTRVLLVEAGPRILTAYSPELSHKALRDLKQLGVTVLLNTRVESIYHNVVTTSAGEFSSENIIWAAGNTASPLLSKLGTHLDRSNRAVVTHHLTLPEHDTVYVIGDAAAISGNPLPGVAQVALQGGIYAANSIIQREQGILPEPFAYNDKGNMATIGRYKAIAEVFGLKLSGYAAWLLWSLIHVAYLINFRNRFRVMIEWIWYYFTFQRGIRLITGRFFKKEHHQSL